MYGKLATVKTCRALAIRQTTSLNVVSLPNFFLFFVFFQFSLTMLLQLGVHMLVCKYISLVGGGEDHSELSVANTCKYIINLLVWL